MREWGRGEGLLTPFFPSVSQECYNHRLNFWF
jgi:hypothetical protein